MSPIVNLQLVVKCKKRSFYSFRVEAALLRYIVFYCELGCDTSEPHVSCISRACSSLVRQPYYAPNSFILKIRGLETMLASEKGRLDGGTFYIDEYTLIFLFSQCIRCAQKRDCWECKRIAFVPHRVVGIQMGSMSVGCPTESRPKYGPIAQLGAQVSTNKSTI